MNIQGGINRYALVTDAYFDGELHHCQGPYTLIVEDGKISRIENRDISADLGQSDLRVMQAAFIMPGMVEAHSHLFLDGGVLDFAARNQYLKASPEEMLAVARANINANLAAGVTLVVDAGDRYGVNQTIRQEPGLAKVRSAGLALRRPGRYGSFMAREVGSREEISKAVLEASQSADDLKVLLTGIIDFKAGLVKGEPQFDADELRFVVELARQQGLRTFVHCSGLKGLEVAVAAGVDSIEHGFFMTADILAKMADQGIAWVPTVSPVHFQWQRPEFAGWDQSTLANLRNIVDSHLEHIELAAELGVDLVAGSDAGSHGVCHGTALIDELDFFATAGLPMDAVLRAATYLPRQRWGVASARLEVGQAADFILLEGSPFADSGFLRRVTKVFLGRSILNMNEETQDEGLFQNRSAVS